MKKVKLSERAILLASILFLTGLVSLISTELDREYVGIIFICIPVCLMTQVFDFENKEFLQMFLAWGLAFAIYNLDTNLYVTKFTGVETLLTSSNWMHWLGVLITGFTCICISMGIMGISNPRIINKKSRHKRFQSPLIPADNLF